MLQVDSYDEFGVPEVSVPEVGVPEEVSDIKSGDEVRVDIENITKNSDIKSGDEVRIDIENITKNSGDNAPGEIQNINPKLTGSKENKEIDSVGKEIQKEESKSVRDEKCNDEMAVEKNDTEKKVDEKNVNEKELAQIMEEVFTYGGSGKIEMKLSQIIATELSRNSSSRGKLSSEILSCGNLGIVRRNLAVYVVNDGTLHGKVISPPWVLPNGVLCLIEISASIRKGTPGLQISVVMFPEPEFASTEYVDQIDLIIISQQYGIENARKFSSPSPNTLNKSCSSDRRSRRLTYSGFISWYEIVDPSKPCTESNKFIILVITNPKEFVYGEEFIDEYDHCDPYQYGACRDRKPPKESPPPSCEIL